MRALLRHPFLLLPPVVYGATVSRTVGLPDSAVIHGAMRDLQLAPHATNHPLTNLLGWLFLHLLPGDNPFLKVNLVSTFGGVAAVTLFYLALLRLGVRRLPAALASAVFMVSHSLWWHAVWVESYALNIVFLLAGLHAVFSLDSPRPRRAMAALLFIAGLSTVNHLQNGALVLAALTVLVLRTRRLPAAIPRGPWFGWTLGALLLGLLPYSLCVLRNVIHEGLPHTLDMVTGGQFRALFFTYKASHLRDLAHLFFLQFPSPWLLFAFCVPWRPRGAVATYLGSAALIILVVFAGYPTWDAYAQLLPVFTVLALAAGVGFGRLWERVSALPARSALAATALACVVLPVWIYQNIGAWTRAGEGYWFRRYGHIDAQYRDRFDLVGLLTDPMGKDGGSCHRFCQSVIAALDAIKRPQGATMLVIDDGSTGSQIEFLSRPASFIMVRQVGLSGPEWISEEIRIYYKVETKIFERSPAMAITHDRPNMAETIKKMRDWLPFGEERWISAGQTQKFWLWIPPHWCH